ncbi:MFS general substrate transporter [Atractiella rhizophila]|nr:MFS general substrate transporter [Atractiella rhizophila]
MSPQDSGQAASPPETAAVSPKKRWSLFQRKTPSSSPTQKEDGYQPQIPRWSLGVLNPPDTEEVPGSVLLFDSVKTYQAPLGLSLSRTHSHHSHHSQQHSLSRTSSRSEPHRSSTAVSHSHTGDHSKRASVATGATAAVHEEKKRTADGNIILDPQPEDSANDPLNWPSWRRDCALFALGWHCLLGGGATPLLAAGFEDVSRTFNVSIPDVALTTGLYMMGVGLGCIIASPTAILFGKRPVYLFGVVLFCASSVWAAASQSYVSLLLARIVMGIGVSPCEALPSATIAEIFFLHERAYRVGIYTLLLLGGKNLVPLVSAVIINAKGWRWVFWVVAIIVGFNFFLLFIFVPETFWDRTPRARQITHEKEKHGILQRMASAVSLHRPKSSAPNSVPPTPPLHSRRGSHVDLTEEEAAQVLENELKEVEAMRGRFPELKHDLEDDVHALHEHDRRSGSVHTRSRTTSAKSGRVPELKVEAESDEEEGEEERKEREQRNIERNQETVRSISSILRGRGEERQDPSARVAFQIFEQGPAPAAEKEKEAEGLDEKDEDLGGEKEEDNEKASTRPPLPHANSSTSIHSSTSYFRTLPLSQAYTHQLSQAPRRTFRQTLSPWNGRLRSDSWFKVALRPFVLFAYPSILWSTVVYACSVGWLIVLSESVAHVYQAPPYNFSPLGTGLVYVSPFLAGILGTAVAGKVSDIIVRFMSKKNGGLYEPEFRLVMAIPIALATVTGLMGFGWSVEEQDAWIVPTVFFGIISFGCTLGSTTAITFAVDSYRQYAGEALVTLNFSKNVLHGLVFSLFFNHWLEHSGPKSVFLALGGIQLGFLVFTIPLFIFGKRLRLWTARANLMERALNF